MEYRKIGKTGMSASVIGLGSEHLDGKPYAVVEETIHAALEHGINIMDLFMPGDEVRRNIGKALGNRRKDMIIQGHIGSVDLSEQYDVSRDLPTCKRYFEKLLDNLGTDYIDVGMLFFMDSDEAFEQIYSNGIVDYALELKQKGVIRAIGTSSHNPVVARKLLETGIVDLMMFSINPAFDMTPAETDVLSTMEELSAQQYVTIDPVRAELYKYCEQQGIAITVMKTLGGGRLLSAEHSPFKKAMSVPQCIHYALTRPGVVSTMIGCQSARQVEEAVAYLNTPEEQRDYMDIISGYQGELSGQCVYCNHCQPCPVNIDIAMVNKYLDIASLDTANIPPSIRQHYKSLAASGADCIACGNCEDKCPFSVPIIKNMERAEELFVLL
ncbi:putative aldo/keto reductase-like oxidoreductase [Parabacteroides sp. PF5-5]|uniref:aldo/keto reductase n=1 Tax=unclassified Parabacteroides TaxID=2649774 RepID=UPI00247716B1|nr:MULTISPECIES: aldo/keto reductase [unclassified Parabacteroides]MDH6305167.1 putative aldo/keto reductase-like oxidoreductase [Parabacteroides sp. PH5-39]MDH6316517.1 putative aldo/keto reductase-like oxidoreductase [Parabacteroides sp. PF5-13]MDH6320027.1 putative aldo/keto reductase-like oxidoreductase [Parabacteroides sp. PH5-13]MDH6323740.1 putative aldo/keto reductase-like oxidoreductase [Parabacteroides sp. PH5-8]MDH6327704.1 putative aldo/keto reductase-like oxidoreductase [Parabacte